LWGIRVGWDECIGIKACGVDRVRDFTAYSSEEIVEFIGYHVFIRNAVSVSCDGIYVKGIVIGFNGLFKKIPGFFGIFGVMFEV
jgi:hypothetical protein